MLSRPLLSCLVLALLALAGTAALAAEPPAPPDAAPDCAAAAAVESLFTPLVQDQVAQSCMYTCFGTSGMLCPDFWGYSVSCVNGCCTYTPLN